MTVVDIDEKLYEKIKESVAKDKITFPTINNFVNKAVKEKLECPVE